MPDWMGRKMVTVEEERLSQSQEFSSSQEVLSASQPSPQAETETEKVKTGAGWLVSQMEETYNKESGVSQSQSQDTNTICRRKSFVYGKLSPEARPTEISLSPLPCSILFLCNYYFQIKTS